MMTWKRLAISGFALAVALVSGPAVAGEKGHGSMPGMHHEGKMEGHGMMKMGDKVFEGKIGPWNAEGRLVDMKAQMAKAKVSEQMMAKMKNTHHIAFSVEDPGTKASVTEGKGTVTVTGPDKKQAKYDMMAMEGHFGADITLDKPGDYEFSTEIESGGKKGIATFHHTLK